jgi:hypothetical protein
MSPVNETIGRQIAWNRLIAIVEEQAQTLIRIAFSARRAISRPAFSISQGGCWPRR